eukprot:9479781-Pyramimonas_sp.AAC.1
MPASDGQQPRMGVWAGPSPPGQWSSANATRVPLPGSDARGSTDAVQPPDQSQQDTAELESLVRTLQKVGGK